MSNAGSRSPLLQRVVERVAILLERLNVGSEEIRVAAVEQVEILVEQLARRGVIQRLLQIMVVAQLLDDRQARARVNVERMQRFGYRKVVCEASTAESAAEGVGGALDSFACRDAVVDSAALRSRPLPSMAAQIRTTMSKRITPARCGRRVFETFDQTSSSPPSTFKSCILTPAAPLRFHGPGCDIRCSAHARGSNASSEPSRRHREPQLRRCIADEETTI